MLLFSWSVFSRETRFELHIFVFFTCDCRFLCCKFVWFVLQMLVVLAVLWLAVCRGCDAASVHPLYACPYESWCLPAKYCNQDFITFMPSPALTTAKTPDDYDDYKVSCHQGGANVGLSNFLITGFTLSFPVELYECNVCVLLVSFISYFSFSTYVVRRWTVKAVCVAVT